MKRDAFIRSGGRVIPHFEAGEFDQLFDDHGGQITWWKARMCACRGQRSDYPNLIHERCGGAGWFYVDPITFQGSNLTDSTKRILDVFGTYAPGELMLTPPTTQEDGARMLFGFNDRLYFPYRTEIHHARKQRGELRADQQTAERIWSPAVSRIIYCAGVNADYAEDTDFQMIADAQGNGTVISWLNGGTAPTQDEYYSIGYEAAPFYHVTEIKYRAEADQRLPQALRLVKFWSPADMLAFVGAVNTQTPGQQVD